MKHHLFNLLALLSTLLAAAIAGEWVGSQFRTDLIVFARNYTYQIRGATRGVYVLRIGQYFTPARQPLDLAKPVLLGPRRFLPVNRKSPTSTRWSHQPLPTPTVLPPQIGWWQRSVVRTHAYDQSANLQETESVSLLIPWWLLLVLAAVLPMGWLTQRLRHKRATPGFPIDTAAPPVDGVADPVPTASATPSKDTSYAAPFVSASHSK
jgi:hypothetical protein